LPSIEDARAEATGYLMEAAKARLPPDCDHQGIVCAVNDETIRQTGERSASLLTFYLFTKFHVRLYRRNEERTNVKKMGKNVSR
jgi:hypothetical protein